MRLAGGVDATALQERLRRAVRALYTAKRFMFRAMAASAWGGDVGAECERGIARVEDALREIVGGGA